MSQRLGTTAWIGNDSPATRTAGSGDHKLSSAVFVVAAIMVAANGRGGSALSLSALQSTGFLSIGLALELGRRWLAERSAALAPARAGIRNR